MEPSLARRVGMTDHLEFGGDQREVSDFWSTYLCPDREPEQVEDSTGLASERPDDGHDRAGHFTGNQDVTKRVLMVG